MDRLVAECDEENPHRSKAHLISVFGGDQEIAAIAAAIGDESSFHVTGPGIPRLTVSLGENPETFRGSITIPGRKRPVRHLIGVSSELALTRAGGDPKARRTVLCDDGAEFLLYRIGIRFGLPVLPEWSDWFRRELESRNAVQRLVGLGCRPVLVTGTKKRFLGWIGHGLRRNRIHVPDSEESTSWGVPAGFP